MKHIRLFVAACAVLVGLGAAVPVVASAETAKNTVCNTLQAGTDCNTTPPGSPSVNTIIKAVINILSFLVGVVAVIMIIFGGFKYVTAGGDSNKVTSAKNTLVYAIVGLVIVAMSQAIVKFVLNKIT